MRTLMLMLGAACLVAGCGKKPKEEAKNTGGGGGGDEFMAVDTGAGGRIVTGGGNQQPVQPPQPQPVPQQRPGGGNTNFQTGAGAIQNVRNAPRRTVSQNDLHQVGVAITILADDLSRMPTAAEIKQSLQGDYRKYLAAIDEGAIVLTGSTNRGGLWAYEVDADTRGGIVLVGGRASRASADEVKQYLANK